MKSNLKLDVAKLEFDSKKIGARSLPIRHQIVKLLDENGQLNVTQFI